VPERLHTITRNPPSSTLGRPLSGVRDGIGSFEQQSATDAGEALLLLPSHRGEDYGFDRRGARQTGAGPGSVRRVGRHDIERADADPIGNGPGHRLDDE